MSDRDVVDLDFAVGIGQVRASSRVPDKDHVGTHEGRVKDDAVRERRRAKSLRTASRSGGATRPRGSSKRPFKNGTAESRGRRR